MPRHVLLGCTPPDARKELRAGLEGLGLFVQVVEDAEGLVRAVATGATAPGRDGEVDLVVVSERLRGGGVRDVCAALEGVTGRAPVLALSEQPIPGADSVAPPHDLPGILDRARHLLAGLSVLENVARVRAGTPANLLDWSFAPSGSPLAPEEVEARLGDLRRRVREEDYYRILGITHEANDAEIRDAHRYQRVLLAELVRSMPSIRDEADEIQTVLDDAAEVLGNPALREAYTRNLG